MENLFVLFELFETVRKERIHWNEKTINMTYNKSVLMQFDNKKKRIYAIIININNRLKTYWSDCVQIVIGSHFYDDLAYIFFIWHFFFKHIYIHIYESVSMNLLYGTVLDPVLKTRGSSFRRQLQLFYSRMRKYTFEMNEPLTSRLFEFANRRDEPV